MPYALSSVLLFRDGEGDDEPGSLIDLALRDDRSPMLLDDVLCDG